MQAQIFNFKDPFDKTSWEVFRGGEGLTVRQRLEQIFPGFVEFERPTYIQANGKDLMRAEWDTKVLKEGDIIAIMPVVGNTFFVVILIAILLAVAVVLFMDIPTISDTSNTKDADPVYGLSGQQNKTRVNEPIEKHYGEVRVWPSYAARSYNQFIGNDQFLYSLFCIGLGEYTIVEELISDALLSGFSEVESEIYQPGERVTLFPTAVETIPEVNGIELFGPNQTGDPGDVDEGDFDGPSGPFATNSPGTTTKKIEHDISFDNGLYSTDSRGNTLARSVTVKFEHRKIDNMGLPLGNWTTSIEKTITFATTTPQRISIPIIVAEGRYEVRGARVNNSDLSNRSQDKVRWISTRSYLEGEQNFPDNVMLWAVKAKATNNLNNQTRSLFNLRVKSKIPVYNSNTQLWTLQETRNPVWIFCDILMSQYGMKLPESFIDLERLSTLAAELETEQIYFDFTFDQRGKIWDACKTVMNVARAKALMRGPLATAVRDVAETTPVAGFNQNNIILGSFRVDTKLAKPYQHDGLLVEYREPETWTAETVLCLIGDDEGINPKQVQFLGCTDRDRAYRWGLYQRAVELFIAENFTFGTGIEGLILQYGDLIAIKHDLLPSGDNFIDEQSGRLPIGAINHVYVDGYFEETQIILPYDAVFTEPEVNTHFISIRKIDGTLESPMVATQTDNPRVISIGEQLTLSDYVGNENSEQPTYFFGANSNLYQLGKVISLNPMENYEVELTAIPYDARLYEFDELIAPALNRPVTPVSIPNFPVIENLTVVTNPEILTQAVASWNPALGATSYVVESSVNGVNFITEGTTQTPSFALTVSPGEFWVRVYGINLGAGVKTLWNGFVGQAQYAPLPPSLLTTSQPFVEDELLLLWSAVSSATSYLVTIKQSGTILREIEVGSNFYTYKNAFAKVDAALIPEPLERALNVEVQSKNALGESVAQIETFTNPLPVAIPSIFSSFVSAAGNDRTYQITASPGANYDLETVTVHLSMLSGFTPDGSNLKATYQSASNPTGSIQATINTGAGVPATVYCKLGCKDMWGEEIVYSAEFTITG